ncbi:MAG: riboflavin synthase [Chloroflexi bacterium]|nr:riboflavin synthase [Chloroflexota bacterium]
MFTGIVEEVGKIIKIEGKSFEIKGDIVTTDISNGDSIAVNGACLTVTNIENSIFTVDVTPETLSRTNLGELKNFDEVNLERSMTLGGRMGGHLVQGHVDCVCSVNSIEIIENQSLVSIELPISVKKYIVEKGYVAIDGISLTVVKKSDAIFSVAVIPYTLSNTVLKNRKKGDLLNLEVDIIAKYIEGFRQVDI